MPTNCMPTHHVYTRLKVYKYTLRPRSHGTGSVWSPYQFEKSQDEHMTLKFVTILQNLIKAYHRKSGVNGV